MSTRRTLKFSESIGTNVAFHLYEDLLDSREEDTLEFCPVYLRLDSVPFEASSDNNGTSVTVTLPREMARALGLLPALEKEAS